ncbi:MAG: RidA family protein [Flavobacteriales bacterium]|jgi:2-iminobutanoate/2-iminopropanoate deaminase
MKKTLRSEAAPAPIGPYSQAVALDGLVFLSGQIALDPSTGTLNNADIAKETHQVMKNVGAVLDAAGCTFNDVVKTTIFLSDMSLFQEVNAVYGTYFTGDFPARETVAVKGLPMGVNVEISVIASRRV